MDNLQQVIYAVEEMKPAWTAPPLPEIPPTLEERVFITMRQTNLIELAFPNFDFWWPCFFAESTEWVLVTVEKWQQLGDTLKELTLLATPPPSPTPDNHFEKLRCKVYSRATRIATNGRKGKSPLIINESERVFIERKIWQELNYAIKQLAFMSRAFANDSGVELNLKDPTQERGYLLIPQTPSMEAVVVDDLEDLTFTVKEELIDEWRGKKKA